ncbi:MAG: 2-isopropylmalate synthase [Planctomycetes bacterium]|nr:2-isopropylmalate synthase [Planctomycetota bacterium]
MAQKRTSKRKRKIRIFDTTLRDGEQSPGASLNTPEKVKIARALEALGVDVIEAGFPITSPGDFEAVSLISETVKKSAVAGLARCMEKDIVAAAKALKKAAKPRIHVFLATSAIHRKYKLKKAKSEIVRLAAAGVKLASKYCDDVEFSPEDASRTEPEFLSEVVEAVIDAGASTVNIPDTVGYAMPEQFGALIAHLRSDVSNIADAVISVHCHNDLGLATANSLAAVANGAGQVECTVNGIGERAGNASLEEVVMAIATRSDFFDCTTGVKTNLLYPTSRLVSGLTGLVVQRNKAVIGENAFAHEAGIHQDGILKERTTYEIMKPADVGVPASKLVLGKHSGRHALNERIVSLGYTPSAEQLEEVYERFKVLADKKKEVFDPDILALIEEQISEVPAVFALRSLHVSSGSHTIPTATLVLVMSDGQTKQDAACGDGPVDAVYKTIDRITGIAGQLVDYGIHAVTSGKDALGEVVLPADFAGRRFSGKASSTDIIEASARAYLQAVNRAAAEAGAPKRASRKGKTRGRSGKIAPARGRKKTAKKTRPSRTK